MICWNDPIQLCENSPFYNRNMECHYLDKIHQNKRKLNLIKISMKDELRPKNPMTPFEIAAYEDVLVICNDDGYNVKTGHKVVENVPKDRWVILISAFQDDEYVILDIPSEFNKLADAIQFDTSFYEHRKPKIIGYFNRTDGEFVRT